MTSGSTQPIHPAELHAMLQARADELAARSAERREARARRARSRGRRGLIATFGAVTLLLTGAIYALGVHDEGFQLEGNVEAADLTFVDIDDAGGGQPTLTPGTLGVTPGTFAGPFDWDSLFDSNGDEIVPRPAGFADAEFVVDYRIDDNGTPGDPSDDSFDTSDGTQFTTGSKDTLDIPEWSCVGGNQVTNKGDIINAYVTLFDSVGGDRILYFGIEKFAGNGDNNVGIWLLQDDGVGCPPDQTGNGTPFSGAHSVGDLFMVAEITNGGGVSSIVAYEWIADTDPGPDVVPGLDENNPVASGADCLDDSAGGDDLCAATNGEEVGVPWPHASSNGTDGLGGDYDPVAFLEGGINLSNFEEFADTCFTGFLFNTRSSQELGATLFDWALGDINTCGSKSGEKVEDLDGDGTIAEDAANDLPGWTINLYADDGTTVGTLDATDTWLDDDVTDANGDYSFGDLFPGDYIVCEESQPDWFQSYPIAAVTESTNSCDALNGAPTNPGGEEQEEWGYAFTISSGEDDTGNDFGNFQQGSKSGTKLDDPNGDGDLTDGTGLENWVINAYADDGDGMLSALEYAAGAAGTDTTDANGDYEITGLDPGDYIACEVLQTDWFQSFPSSGADCTTDSGATDLAQWGHAFTVTSGSSEEDNDFGNFQQGSKSGTKLDDPNGDGDLTDGTGLENWVINAYADDGDGMLSALEYAAGAAGTDTTDANGDYEITGLDPGDYIACEVLQTDWFQSFPSSGADCTTDSGATDLAQWGHAFTVTSGSSEEDNDFGNFQQGSKSGTKLDDPNGDGDLTDGTGLENWVINAYADDGDGMLSALEYAAGAAGTDTTDANGDYEITGLDPGDYIACEVLQTDWFQSFPSSGADCTTDSGATDLAQWGHAFTVTSGSSEEDNDFGNFQQGSKSGTKLDDPNGDGDLTDGTGLENWVINAYADDGDGMLSALEYAAGAAGTDTTDANGDYEITGLDPGDYIACEVLQTDWFQSFPSSGADCTTDSGATDLAQWGHAFTVTSGSSEEDNDFGNFQQGSKSGTKLDDPNGDGDLTDGTGLENWVINAYADDGDGMLSALEYAAGAAGTDTTDANGDYEITGLDPGDYIACEVLQTDWFQSFPSSGADCTTDSGATDLAQWGHAFTVTSGSSEEDNDFGNFQQGSKSGTKLDDPNGDGDLTDGTGLENWVINAYADDGDGMLSALEYAAGAAGTDTTDANGDYEITGLDPGDYIACEVLQTDWFQSFPSSGADCTTDSGATDLAQWGHAFTVTSGSSEEDNDFGNFQQGSKSGTKFDDMANHGVWDLGEPGLAGWTIHLFGTDGQGTAVHLTAVTDANGLYTFTGLNPGSYTVCEELQTGWTQSFPTTGADCTGHTDGGTITPGPLGYAITITSGEDETGNDFGNFLPPQEGCTPGFWQGGVGIQLWNTVADPDWTAHGGVGTNPFIQSQTFVSFFPSSGNVTVDNMTMLEIVGSGGTNVWERKAARDLIAAYLNASFGIDYPYDTTTILADWNTAVAGGTQGFKDFHTKYDTANNLGCPL